jgi:tripartite-type tricarboxylate transporter receptor subunit TctC
MAPAKTPPEALAQLADWFQSAMKADEVKPKLAQQGLFPAVKCGAAFAKFMKDLTDDYTRVVKEAGIKVK